MDTLTGIDKAGITALFIALGDELDCEASELIPPDLFPAIEALLDRERRKAGAKLTAIRTLLGDWESQHTHLGIERATWGPSSSSLHAVLDAP
jgi:hypothetical protein